MIKRYTYDMSGSETGCDQDELVEHEKGEWVRTEDHEAEVERLKEEVADLNHCCDHATGCPLKTP